LLDAVAARTGPLSAPEAGSARDRTGSWVDPLVRQVACQLPPVQPLGREGDAFADWCEMAVNPAWAEHADRDVVTAISRPRGRL